MLVSLLRVPVVSEVHRFLSTIVTAVILMGAISATSAADLDRILLRPGGNPLPATRDIRWSEPPDLEGNMGSSERIPEYGLETELANDFWVDEDCTLTLARWWGGYWNYNPGDPLMTSFTLRFFADNGCLPGDLLYEVFIPSNAHEMVIIVYGNAPICVYHYPIEFQVLAGEVYWFLAQAGDHPYPPQWGRLQSVEGIGCEAAFRSEYFGYPNWEVACSLPPMIPCEFSQEFEDEAGPIPASRIGWGRIRHLYR